MSTADRNHFTGKSAGISHHMLRVGLIQTDRVRDRAVEARAGATLFRREIWRTHDYNCDDTHWKVKVNQKKHQSMQPCAVYAAWNGLWGERENRMHFSFEVTDNHW